MTGIELDTVPKTAIWLYPQYPFSEDGDVKSNLTAATLVTNTPFAGKSETRVADWTPLPTLGLLFTTASGRNVEGETTEE